MSIDLMPGFGAFTPTASGGGTPLLDTGIASATNGYSLRKLRAAYAGSAIRIRRSSDNTEQDIGFSGNDLNTSAISSFVGANDAFIVTWYDQVGSDNLAAFSNTNQPRIVNAGALETINSLPAINFYAAHVLYDSSVSTLNGISQFTAAAVASLNSASEPYGRLVSFQGASTGSDYASDLSVIMLARDNTGQGIVSYRNSGPRSSQSIAAYDQQFTAISYYDASNNTVGVDGTNGTSSSFSAVSLDGTGGTLRIGAENDNAGNGKFAGTVSEAVIWASALSSGDRATVQSNQKTYWGTP
jgi:hypothetical protein